MGIRPPAIETESVNYLLHAGKWSLTNEIRCPHRRSRDPCPRNIRLFEFQLKIHHELTLRQYFGQQANN